MRTKNIILSLTLIFAVFLSACSGAAVAQEKAPVTRTINVSGNAQAFLSPDIAYITIGVHTENADAQAALTKNNEQAQAVIDLLKAQGIAEKDLRTSNFSIYPSTQYTPEGVAKGTIYMVDNTVSVTVRDLTKIGELLNAAAGSGANSISGIQFDVADKAAAMTEARKAALDNAHKMAEEMAAAAGVTLGEIQNITFYGNAPTPIYMGYGGANKAAEMAASVPVQTGQLTLSVDVNVVYEIQ